MIDGITVGQTRTFFETNIPPGSKYPAGTTIKWSSSDVTIATVPDSNPDASGVTVPVTGVAEGTFTLTVTATKPDSTIVQKSVQVPVTAAIPTDMNIDEQPAA